MLQKLKKYVSLIITSVMLFSNVQVTAAENEFIIYGTDTRTSNIEAALELDPKMTFTEDTSTSKIRVLAQRSEINTTELFKSTFPDGIWFKYEFDCPSTGWYNLEITTAKDNGYESKFDYGVDSEMYNILDEYKVQSAQTVFACKNMFYITEGKHTFTYRINDIAKTAKYVHANFFQAKFTKNTTIENKVTTLISRIDAIGEVTLEDESEIVEIREEYDALAEDIKSLVLNYDKLVEAESTLEELKENASQITEGEFIIYGTDTRTSNIEAALELDPKMTFTEDASTSKIRVLAQRSEINTTDLFKSTFPDGIWFKYEFNCPSTGWYNLEITTAKDNGYESKFDYGVDGDLHDISKEYGVYSNQTVFACGNMFYITEGKHSFTYRINNIAKNAGYVHANFFQVKFTKNDEVDESITALINRIDAIGEVSLSDESEIKDIREAYDALNADKKALVANYNKLVVAEATLAQLKENALIEERVNLLKNRIDAIGVVTLEDESEINYIREEYDALEDDVKALVTNYNKLVEAEATLAQLKENASIEEIVNAIKNRIDAIGEVTLSDESEIKAIRADYDALEENVKSLVTNYNKLVEAEVALTQLKQTTEEFIIYGTDARTSNIEAALALDSKMTFAEDTETSKIRVLANKSEINTTELFKATYPDGIWFKYEFECPSDGWYKVEITTAKDNGFESKFDYGVDAELYNINDEYGVQSGKTVFECKNMFYITEGKHTFTYRINDIAKTAKYVHANFFQAKFTLYDVDRIVAALKARIDAIGEITIEDDEEIQEIRKEYDALTDSAKLLVTNYEKFAEAEAILGLIKEGAPLTPIIIKADKYSSKSADLSFTAATATAPVQFKAVELPDGGLSIVYEFVVLKDGTYRVDLSSGIYNHDYMSTYGISIDDGQIHSIDATTIAYTEDHLGGETYTTYLKKYKTNILKELEKGLHTFTIHITAEKKTGTGSMVWIYVEQMKLVLEEEVNDVKFEQEVLYTEIGQNLKSQLSFTGADSGEKIIEENLSAEGAAISYSSNNSGAIAVDKDGALAFNSFGQSDIKAEVKYKNFTGETIMNARTTVDGLFVTNPVFSDATKEIQKLEDAEGKLKVTAQCVNTKQSESTIYLVLAVYDNDVLKTYEKKPCTVVAGENTIEVEITDFSYAPGLCAELFVWGDENIPKLVAETSVIK